MQRGGALRIKRGAKGTFWPLEDFGCFKSLATSSMSCWPSSSSVFSIVHNKYWLL